MFMMMMMNQAVEFQSVGPPSAWVQDVDEQLLVEC